MLGTNLDFRKKVPDATSQGTCGVNDMDTPSPLLVAIVSHTLLR